MNALKTLWGNLGYVSQMFAFGILGIFVGIIAVVLTIVVDLIGTVVAFIILIPAFIVELIFTVLFGRIL